MINEKRNINETRKIRKVRKDDTKKKTRKINETRKKTKSWKSQAPNTKERTIMLRNCGKKCFLGPYKTFPICSKRTCKINNKGVLAAYIRARQFRKKGSKYYKIAKEATKILAKLSMDAFEHG
jgi:hypothetical protein